MSEYCVRDAEKKWWIQVPNFIDDCNLSVYAFRLYVHLKRVAGNDGICWQSVATLAKNCNMSEGSIYNAREELEKLNLIKVSEVKNPNGGKNFKEITIVDIWDINMRKYATTSPHELATSRSEVTTSPHEIKNNPLRITHEETGATVDPLFKEYYENISPYLSSFIAEELINYEKDMGKQVVIDAIHEATAHGKKTWAYIKAILDNWNTNGRTEKKPKVEHKYLEEYGCPIYKPT